MQACTYDLPPGGRFDTDMRWSVPAHHKTATPNGRRLTHDDRLLSAALIAHADTLIQAGRLPFGHARSAVIPPPDPLSGLQF